MHELHKYPRTPHLAGSRLQAGDETLAIVPLAALQGEYLVVEEKLDGANAGISFSSRGELLLQSRGHFLVGGPREQQFHLFKAWAAVHRDALHAALRNRYVLYGEWLYAKHTIYYDALPHYFLAFDVLDTATGVFLASAARESLLGGLPVRSAPRLWCGRLTEPETIIALLGPSRYRTARWRTALSLASARLGLAADAVLSESDPSCLMEGLYIKAEAKGRVVARCKLVRESFRVTVDESGSHWLDRPLLPNRLAAGVDLFAPAR